jgi:hypothetical protein
MNIQKSYRFVFNLPYLVPWRRVLNSSSASPKRFPAFNGTQRFTTALTVPFTCPCHEPGTCIPFPTFLFKIHFNIIRLSISRSYKWALSLWFPHQRPEWISLLYRRVTTHSPWFDHSNNPPNVVVLYSVLIWYPAILSYYPQSLVTNVIFR